MAGLLVQPAKALIALLILISLPSLSQGFWGKEPDNNEQPPLECELYLAESTIPGAGFGLFSGVAKNAGEYVGNGDKAIPLIDVYWHNGGYMEFFNPTADYVWDGSAMGMKLELFDPNDVSAFWPGIDAMVNCHYGLLNLEKAMPIYDEAGVHRSLHHGAGGISNYEASDGGSSYVSRDIPAGGELFKGYGDHWFTHRPHLGQLPIQSSYATSLMLMSHTKAGCEDLDFEPSIMYEELWQPLKDIWDSRTLNALYDFSWKDIELAIEHEDIGVLLQPNATRSIDWLNQNGKCVDHIVHKRSTIEGAGAGAFAKRDLPEGTIITGTPLLVFRDEEWFNMYDFITCPDGRSVRNTTKDPYGKQLLLNYCFAHPESSMVLCPLGSGVNYINHNQTVANVKIRWAKDGVLGHRDAFFEVKPFYIDDYSTRVAFEYVATRDIAEGEELFLDYGDLWEEKFQQLGENWQTFDRTHLDDYISATQYNAMYPMDPLWTTEELRLMEYNPHPGNLHLRCHYLVDELNENGVFAYEGEPSELVPNWTYWSGDNTGYECEILMRVDEGASYIVRYKYPNVEYEDGYEIRTITNVPRQAIKFFDDPYTTDIHMYGVFRQALGLPDDMLPDAWRRDSADVEEEQEQGEHDDSLEYWCGPQTPDSEEETEEETVADAPSGNRLHQRPHSFQRIRGSDWSGSDWSE